MAILKGDNQASSRHNYLAVAATAVAPKFVFGIPLVSHFARHRGGSSHQNTIFAMAVGKCAKDSSAAKLASETKSFVAHKGQKEVGHVSASVSKALKAPSAAVGAPNAK